MNVKEKLKEIGVEFRRDELTGGYNLYYKYRWLGGKSFGATTTSWWCEICCEYWHDESEDAEEYFLEHILQHFLKGDV